MNSLDDQRWSAAFSVNVTMTTNCDQIFYHSRDESGDGVAKIIVAAY